MYDTIIQKPRKYSPPLIILPSLSTSFNIIIAHQHNILQVLQQHRTTSSSQMGCSPAVEPAANQLYMRPAHQWDILAKTLQSVLSLSAGVLQQSSDAG